MPRISYVTGRYLPHERAAVHIEDRGFQFADGVYEVCAVVNGDIIDMAPHLERLRRSLAAVEISCRVGAALEFVLREVVRRNRVRHGLVYLQINRGRAPRDHGFPPGARASVIVCAAHGRPDLLARRVREGVDVITLADNRWGRCDIKSVGLLANVLAKQAARRAGAFEAWFLDEDGYVTEGSSTNAFIVTRRGEIVSRAPFSGILDGITRRILLDIARDAGIAYVERPFHRDEALAAREAFIASTTAPAVPVVRIDGHPVGRGTPGAVATKLHNRFFERL